MKHLNITKQKRLIVLFGCLGMHFLSNAETKLTIEYDKEFQTIDNFGASDAWIINPLISKWQRQGKEKDIEKLANLLFSEESGIGLSGWRFNIGAGSSEQGANSLIGLDNLNKDYRRAELLQPDSGADIEPEKQSGQIRFLQEAYHRGVSDFVAFSNSPPVWATKNGLAHPNDGSGIGSTNLDPDKVTQYAEFLVDVLEYLRGDIVGVPVNYISPVNEPSWEWQGKSQEGNRYNNEDLIRVYSELYNALQRAGLNHQVEIDAGEVAEYTAALSDSRYRDFSNSHSNYGGGMNSKGLGLYRNYIDKLLGDEGLREKLGNKISLHGYFSDIWADRMGELRDLVNENVTAVSPDAKIWMSEFSILGGTGDARNFDGNGWDVNDIDYALHVSKVLHRDLTRLNASAWHWWLGVTAYNYKDGLIKVNSELDAESLQTSKVLWTLGHYSRFIRPGYVRIGLDRVDNLNGLMASAYKSDSDERIVVVLANASGAAQDISFEMLGLPQDKVVSSFVPYLTNNAEDLSMLASEQLLDGYTVPAKSIVTLVADLTDVSSSPHPSFIQNRVKVAEGGVVSFSSTTTNAPDSLLWSFPGGSPEASNLTSPEITYARAGSYDVELTATNNFGSDTYIQTQAVTVLAEQECESDGYLNLETWMNIVETGDYSQDSSPSSIPFSEPATETTISVFEIEADTGDNYGTRIRGYVCAPASGEYKFWIASDNQGELWLSTDEDPANKQKIAYSSDWNNFREWDKYESQQSEAIYLIAGQKYYVETLHKEHNGGDNLSVGWQLPDGALERPITAAHLTRFTIDDNSNTNPDPEPTPETNKSDDSGASWSLLYLLACARLFIPKKRNNN
ncbi:glycoside hydrolase [Thalassotalea sp. PS06]|uniref:glycoside hydrolase n=1 Tax=Thalassotalea sp. PS06 TaxID=2594005 RepID=UPI001165A1FD|nr:glycoside hydrolase [Thalassotalea sp. PS06]QDP00214.1 PKD domain-containing protein [Thalassotalea sp. PS06]